MYILGIHGWPKREHDSSACLIKDGKIIAMAEEERFTRKKHAFDSVPINATLFCLDQAKITLDKVDIVSIGYDRKKLCSLRGIPFDLSDQEVLETLLPKKYFNYTKYPKLRMIDHHLAHAASSYYTSGFKEAAVLIIDGQGEDCSASLGYALDGKINLFTKISIQNSLGYFYESISKFLGFGLHGAGKVMGLAAYGDSQKYQMDSYTNNNSTYEFKPTKSIEIFNIKNESIDEQGIIIEAWVKYFMKELKLSPINNSYSYNHKTGRKEENSWTPTEDAKNLAASAQDLTEDILLFLCQVLKERTESNNLVISGGVGLNCSANGRIVRSGIFNNVFIFPAANDAGVALGSSLKVYYEKAKYDPCEITDVYLGPSFSNDTVEQILKRDKISYTYVKKIEQKTAELLADGGIIGWFQGRMEVGPRALGNRSILADPRSIKNRDLVNSVKNRESWRPLSPSIIEGFENQYFENPSMSRFMLMSYIVKKEASNKIPAVVHFDKTARPQIVSKLDNKRYHKLITEFYKITDVPVLLNTSFNDRGKPIVCTPEDALKMFYSSPLDYLVIDNYLLIKKDPK